MRLCPQEYDGLEMKVTPCSRCRVGWDKLLRRCVVPTGAEHFPLVEASEIPTCPIQDRCQHQVQRQEPCPIRARGMICESALVVSGLSAADAFDHSLSFNATVVASPEEWARIEREGL